MRSIILLLLFIVHLLSVDAGSSYTVDCAQGKEENKGLSISATRMELTLAGSSIVSDRAWGQILKASPLSKLQDIILPSLYYGNMRKCHLVKFKKGEVIRQDCLTCFCAMHPRYVNRRIVHCNRAFTSDKEKDFPMNNFDTRECNAKFLGTWPSSLTVFGEIISDVHYRTKVADSVGAGVNLFVRRGFFQLILQGIGVAVNIFLPLSIPVTGPALQVIHNSMNQVGIMIINALDQKLKGLNSVLISKTKCFVGKGDVILSTENILSEDVFKRVAQELNKFQNGAELTVELLDERRKAIKDPVPTLARVPLDIVPTDSRFMEFVQVNDTIVLPEKFKLFDDEGFSASTLDMQVVEVEFKNMMKNAFAALTPQLAAHAATQKYQMQLQAAYSEKADVPQWLHERLDNTVGVY